MTLPDTNYKLEFTFRRQSRNHLRSVDQC